jgi:hypothetical protein
VRFDLPVIHELCREIGLAARIDSGTEAVEIDVGEGAILRFENAKGDEDDCVVGFLGTPSHWHGNFEFVDGRGHYVELDYLSVVTGLKDGHVLICERRDNGGVVDRWLVHRDYNDEFKYMEENETIVVRREATNKSS